DRLRTLRSDYLFNALIDVPVDRHFLALERVGEEIETLTEQAVVGERESPLRAIHRLKTDLLDLWKGVWLLREVGGVLARGEWPWIEETPPFTLLQRVCEHTIQSADCEIVTGHLAIHLTSPDNPMNELMKALTIIVTLFLSACSTVGDYGMNAAYMPELRWRSGNHAVVVTMAAVSAVMK
ncbi:MAG: CorA family divalent cation transporter, partial [Candidatus Oleimicrobiaceae bacterium]